MVEGGISEVVKMGGVGRGVEEAIIGTEVAGGKDLPEEEICRGAGDLVTEVSLESNLLLLCKLLLLVCLFLLLLLFL